MSESAHSTRRYELDPSSAGDSGALVDDADSADERAQNWDAPQEAQRWPEGDPSPEPEEPLPASEEQTTEFVRPVPDDEDWRGRRAGARTGGTATGIWIGLAVVAGGFAAIFFSWSKVAGLTNVAQQVPYLVSSGLLGLALVIAGAAIVDVFVRRWDSGERKAQIAQMTEALSEVRELLELEPPARPEGE